VILHCSFRLCHIFLLGILNVIVHENFLCKLFFDTGPKWRPALELNELKPGVNNVLLYFNL